MRDDQDGDGMADDPGSLPPSLLPYERWIELAYREVMVRALRHAEAEGLPGAHHFYITFRTNIPGVQIPTRLLAQYPQEMTIILQHQYWDLKVDQAAALMSVGLSFGSVPSTLVIPFAAITGFADPQVRLVLRFKSADEDAGASDEDADEAAGAQDAAPVTQLPVGQLPVTRLPGTQLSPTGEGAGTAEAAPATEADNESEADAAPQVVSLDAFRKRGSTPN